MVILLGLWLRELRESRYGSAGHVYIGTDIVPEFFPPTSTLPRNINLQLQSINETWPKTWLNSFGYVHQRSVLVGAGTRDNLEACVDRIAGLVEPGGWIELLEADLSEPATDEKASRNGPAVKQFVDLLKRILDGPAGVGHAYSKHMKSWLQALGFEDTQEVVFSVPFGSACVEDGAANDSVTSLRMTVEGLLNSLTSK